MGVSEFFAYNVGTLARLYIDFKNQVKEKSNSLSEILTYIKYDRKGLQSIFSRIGLGINRSRAIESEKNQIRKRIFRFVP